MNIRWTKCLCTLAGLTLAGGASAHLKNLTLWEIENWAAENIQRVAFLDHNAHAGEFLYVLSDPSVQEKDGKSCLVGGLFVFDVDDDFAFDIDENVTLEVTLHRPTTEGIITSYDKVTGQTYIEKHAVDQSLDSLWHTETIVLERAAFANRVRGSSDFMIGAFGAVYKGELDLGSDDYVSICGIRVVRDPADDEPAANGRWKLTLIDETGKPTSARVGLYTLEGRAPLPSDDALPVNHLYGEDRRRAFTTNEGHEHWPGLGRYIFWADGEYETEVPAGDYQVVVTKGFEYRFVDERIRIEAGRTTTTAVELERWANMPDKGWYSGDAHIHIGRDRSDNEILSAMVRAEDVHMGFMLQMGNIEQKFFEQYAFGDEGIYQIGNYALVSGQENPRTGDLGHVISMGNKQYYDFDDYYLYGDVADAVHADGGLWGYAHAALGPAIGLPESMAHTVPFGQVDFVEQLQYRYMITLQWYDFLNLGFRISPVAGSDAPYLNLVGSDRFYVHTGAPTLDPQAFYGGLRAGKAFVTSGPMLEMTVNGEPLGSTLHVDAGETVKIEITATINPDIDMLKTLELVMHGEVIAAVDVPNGVTSLALSHTLELRDGAWFAARAFGSKPRVSPFQHQTQAHTGATYVTVGGDDFFGDRDQLKALTEKYLVALDYLHDKRPLAMMQNERDHFDQSDNDRVWDASIEEIRRRAAEARRIFEQRLERYGR